MRFPDDYLRRVFLGMKVPTTLQTLVIVAARQSGRLLLAVLLGWLAFASTQFWSESIRIHPYFMIEPMLLVSGGFALLVIELLGMIARGFLRLPTLGTEETGLGVAWRACAGAGLVFIVAAANLHLGGGALEVALALLLFGFNVPGALRSMRDLGVGLRSLPPRLEAVTPGGLTGRGAVQLGRQVVVGRTLADAFGVEVLGVEAEGATARVVPEDAAWLVDLEREPGRARSYPHGLAIVADASSDGHGYRGAGVRLTARGLPMWILDAQDAASRLQAYARRLHFGRLLDGTLVMATLLIGSGLAGVALSLYAR